MSSISSSELGGGPAGTKNLAPARRASYLEAEIDAQLARRTIAGDDEAFGEIVRRHRGRIFGLVMECVHNRADADELVADTFIRAHRGLRTFRGDSSLATWLHHIAMNLARNRYWYSFRRRHLSASLDAPVSAESDAHFADFVASDEPDPREVLDQCEFSTTVTRCLGALPERQRHILQLRAGMGRTYAEIAGSLGISIGTAKSRIARARRALRKDVDVVCADLPRS